jgi:hypothetical protein
MLFWLEEAAVETAMIAATAIGAFMFVAAVVSLVTERLRLRERRSGQAATVRYSAPGRRSHPTRHPA